MRRITLILVAVLIPVIALSHGKTKHWEHVGDRHIVFPDLADRLTLTVDLHTHSVFSDGHVWPRTRAEEALMDGLDAIAITEHLEWQPHRVDLPNPDLNRAYEIARDAAVDEDLMVIPGVEITRRDPYGHINAVFIQDANAMIKVTPEDRALEDASAFWDAAERWPAEEALAAANEQGAFTFWNHPSYTGLPEGVPKITEFIRSSIDNGQIQGIEVVNGQWYSEQSFQIALDNDLTLIGTSDIHELIDWDYMPYHGGHRPVTLVFTEERSQASMKQALVEKRTAIYYNDMLIARPREMGPLLDASLTVESAEYRDGNNIATITFRNHSELPFLLENRSALTFQFNADLVEIPPHSDFELHVTMIDRPDTVSLAFNVLNALVEPKKAAVLRYTLDLDNVVLPGNDEDES